MVRRSGYGFAVAAAAVGCSLITPLDYVGGSVEGSGGRASAAGSGGTTGGRGGNGGTNPEGGTGEGALGGDGGGGNGGGGNGGVSGSGAAGGGGTDPEGGAAGDAGQGGLGESGSGGSGNAGVGGAGVGGMGGAAGSAGGGGCAGADLVSDPMHCGACGTVCGGAEYCIEGACIASPCDGLCPTFVTVPLAGDGFRMDDIGTAEQCFEVVGYERTSSAAALICWNFLDPRTLEVNGTPVACMTEPGVTLGAERAGGYCLKAGSGDHPYAGFKFPLP